MATQRRVEPTAPEGTEEEEQSPSPLTSIAIGIFAGSLSGLFGLGGGILVVPALVTVGKMSQRRAHATSLAAAAPMAASGLIGYAVAGEVDWLVAAILLSGSVIGAVLGTRLLRRINQRALKISFAVLLLLTAVRVVTEIPTDTAAVSLDAGTGVGLGGVGLFAGAIAGLLGVGGGVILVPAQTVAFAIPAALAKGTSLAVIVPTAIVGTVQNVRYKVGDLRTAAWVGGAGVIFSYLASQVSVGLDPVLAAWLFGILLAVASLRLFMQLRR